MTPAELDHEYAAVVRKWARTIADMGGRVPLALLADLADIANQHARDIAAVPASGSPPRKRPVKT